MLIAASLLAAWQPVLVLHHMLMLFTLCICVTAFKFSDPAVGVGRPPLLQVALIVLPGGVGPNDARAVVRVIRDGLG